MSQEKYGSEAMYLPPAEDEEFQDEMYQEPYVDRSALLRATLNSLAMSNVASVLNSKKHKKGLQNLNEHETDENSELEEEEIKRLEDVFKIEENTHKEENKN